MKAGRVAKMVMVIFHRPPKGISVHKRANNDAVHLTGFEKPGRLVLQTLGVRP
jgi:hypothetical protein